MNLPQKGSLRKNFRWKDRVISLHFAWNDPATPLFAKCLIAFAIFYLISPIDLIPDFIPVAGWMDDIFIVPFLLTVAERSLPIRVRERAQHKAANLSRQFQIIFWALITVVTLLVVISIYSLLK